MPFFLPDKREPVEKRTLCPYALMPTMPLCPVGALWALWALWALGTGFSFVGHRPPGINYHVFCFLNREL